MKIRKINIKKGDVSMSTLVMAIIAITVLLVVILIFTNNVRKPSKEFQGLSNTNTSKCTNIIFGRTCLDRTECIKDGGVVAGGYAECTGDQVCCEKK